MPSCVIKSCKNSTKAIKKAEGITFHKFPTKIILRDKWVTAVRLSRNEPQWQPSSTSVLCSVHFDKRDMYDTTHGIRRIHTTGYPKKMLFPPSNAVISDTSILTPSISPPFILPTALAASSSASPGLSVCRVCLALDVRLFDMNDFKLTDMFQNITGISVCDEKENILRRVCWECAARLTAAAAFRNKALLSDALLKDKVLNKSDIVKLKHIYQNALKSPLTIQTVFTSSDIGCEDTSPDYKEIESLTDEKEIKEEEPLVILPMKTNVGSDPLAENDSNIQIDFIKNEIISALTDTTENSEVYYNNNDKVLNEDAVMTNASKNDVSYIDLAIGDEENKPKLEVISNTVNEFLSDEDSESLAEVAAANKARKMMIGKVEASCEQGNGLNDGEKQKFIALKENGLSVAEISEETVKSSTIQNIKTVNRLSNQLTPTFSLKHMKPVTIQDLSPSTCNVAIKDDEIFITNDVTDKNHDGFNDARSKDDIIVDTDALSNRNGSSEEENTLSDKEIKDSSNDNLPAEKYKAKTTRKTKEEAVKTAKEVQKTKDPTKQKTDRRKKPIANDDWKETLFTITLLTFEEQMAEFLKRQESASYKNSFLKCTACFSGYAEEHAYKSHMSRHTDLFGELECKICKKHFKNWHKLNDHITTVHARRYSCKQCTFVTMHRQTAKLHGSWHKGTKYRCPHCPEEFVKFTTYMGHVRVKHPSDFVCDLCGYSFISAKGIAVHKKLKHRLENVQIPEDGPLCELCNVRFISSEAHKRHLRVSAKHNTGKRELNKLKKSKKSKKMKESDRDKDTDIDERRRIFLSQMRKAEEPIPCEQCGIQLQGARAYHFHFKTKHPDKNRTNYPAMKNPCMCEVCGKMFQSYALLKYHTGVHTGEKTFKCDSCGKSYRSRQNLNAHRRVHSQERRTYACKLCGKTFSTSGNCSRHMFTHTDVRPSKCEMCGKGFKTLADKKAHVSYVHLKKPWPKRKREKRRNKNKK